MHIVRLSPGKPNQPSCNNTIVLHQRIYTLQHQQRRPTSHPSLVGTSAEVLYRLMSMDSSASRMTIPSRPLVDTAQKGLLLSRQVEVSCRRQACVPNRTCLWLQAQHKQQYRHRPDAGDQ